MPKGPTYADASISLVFSSESDVHVSPLEGYLYDEMKPILADGDSELCEDGKSMYVTLFEGATMILA